MKMLLAAALAVLAVPVSAGDNDHEDEIESPCDLIKGGRQGLPKYRSGRDWCIPPADYQG